MAQPLATFLAVLLAFSAWSLPARKTPAQLKAELGQGFATGAELSTADLAGQTELLKLVEQAKYIQGGREPSDQKETYIAFIRSVARRLNVKNEAAVKLYGERVREKRAVAPTQDELDARMAIAVDVKRNPTIPEATKARMGRDARATSAALRGMMADANFVPDPGQPAKLNVTYTGYSSDNRPRNADGTINWSALPPQVQPVKYASGETPSPVVASGGLSSLPSAISRGLYSLSELGSHIDLRRGAALAWEATTNVFESLTKKIHSCWRAVKQALIDNDDLKVANPQSTAVVGIRPGAAEMFNTDVEKNPAILDRLGYRRAKLSDLTDPAQIPQGSIFIYGKKCGYAYYDKKVGSFVDHGHSELSVDRSEYERVRREKKTFKIQSLEANEVPMCYYTCVGRSVAYLRTKGTGDKACLRMYVPVKSS